MLKVNGDASVGMVGVMTTSHGGHSPETLAELATNRIISVGGESHPAIRDQATAFRTAIYDTLVHYMRQMARSERTSIVAQLRRGDMHDIADIIEKL